MSEKNIAQIEKRLTTLKNEIQQLSNANIYDQLLQIIHKPGWTTPAEARFFETTMELISAQVQSLARAQQGLLEASQAVGGHATATSGR
jgi:prefoldin subunit 5